MSRTMQSPDDDVYVDERELARRTGLSARYFQRLRQEGRGPPYAKLSARCVRYSWARAKAWLAAHEEDPTGADIPLGEAAT